LRQPTFCTKVGCDDNRCVLKGVEVMKKLGLLKMEDTCILCKLISNVLKK